MGNGTRRKKGVEETAIPERLMAAMELRKSGFSYRKIGERLGISHVQAYRDVHTELARLAVERSAATEEYRQLELERLDKIMQALDHWVEAANPQAINSYLRAMERRAKLLGLDAPVVENVNLNVDLTDAERSAEIVALLERARARQAGQSNRSVLQ